MSDYMRIWKLRKIAIEGLLGPAEDGVFTSAMPIYLGGFADVMSFSEFVPGKVYVTGGLVGLGAQQPNKLGTFELMICTREEAPWAADLLSRLARYTHDAVLSPNDTMDVGSAMPRPTKLSALLFARPDMPCSEFVVDGERAHLLLCVGITATELRYKQRRGADALLDRLRAGNVLPYTDRGRAAVV